MADPVLSDFSDGRTAALYRVDVRVSAGGLAIRGQGASAYWQAEGLEIVDAPDNESTLRLTHRDQSGARLVISDADLKERILSTFDVVSRNRRDGRRRDLKRVAWAGGVIGILVAVFFLTLPSIVSTLTALVPHETEKRMGEQAYGTFSRFVEGTEQNCVAPRGRRVLDSIVTQLADGMALDHPVDVHVVPSEIVNAVAFPGGRILVFDGLLQQAESAEEVAGVIAHEIGHAHHRHGIQGLIRSSAIDAVISVFAPGRAGEMGADLGGQLLNQSYGRDAEREADAFAIQHLNRINVRTDGMAEFFERMARKHRSSSIEAFKYFSSHPASSERSETIRSGGTGTRSMVSPVQWKALRDICTQTEPAY